MTLLNNTSPEKQPREQNTLQVLRKDFFNRLIRIIGIFGTIIYIFTTGLGLFGRVSSKGYLFVYTLIYLAIAIAAFYKKIPTTFRAYLLVVTVFAVGIAASLEKAAVGDGRIWLILSVFLAILFLGRKAGGGFILLSVASWFAIGILFNKELLSYEPINQFSSAIWNGTTITLLIASATIVISTAFLLGKLNDAIKESQNLTQQTIEQNKEIKFQRDMLDRRSTVQEIVAKISKHLASLITKEDLLEEAPKLLDEQLALNNVSVFLVEPGKNLRLASSSVWNEQVYTRRDYAISLYEDIVGLAVIEGQAYLNSDTSVGLKSVFPGTQSYLVLPLRGRNEILGALVLQSEQEKRFDVHIISVLQVFADQFALLVENATLLAERESALEAERRAYGDITGQAWDEFLERGNAGAFRRDQYGIHVFPAEPYRKKSLSSHTERFAIRVRGKVIGYVEANKSKNRAWTTSEKELLQILTSRLETALENARLYQISQAQAKRERIIAETSSRMRETLSIEKVLETAALELRKALGADEAEIWLEPLDDEA